MRTSQNKLGIKLENGQNNKNNCKGEDGTISKIKEKKSIMMKWKENKKYTMRREDNKNKRNYKSLIEWEKWRKEEDTANTCKWRCQMRK